MVSDGDVGSGIVVVAVVVAYYNCNCNNNVVVVVFVMDTELHVVHGARDGVVVMMVVHAAWAIDHIVEQFVCIDNHR